MAQTAENHEKNVEPLPTEPQSSKTQSRRRFLRSVAAGGVGATFATGLTAASYARVKGANDKVRFGVVGIRGMGFSHVKNYSRIDGAEVAAVCDVDESILNDRVAEMAKLGLPKPAAFVDIRKLLDRDDIDAISVATPNHWHALAAYWAVQSGKHAAIEKPGTHNFFEGRQLIKASDKYGRMIQHHAERRTFEGFQSAIAFLREGGLGEVYMAKGLCYKWRDTIGRLDEGPVPDGVHYDLWLGPAPSRPFSPNRFHYNWHWHWDYGNGDLGNQGAHQMDIARWGLDVALPTRVTAMGGHYMFDDDQETPNTLIAAMEFPCADGGGDRKKLLQFEVRHWISNHEGGLGQGAGNNIGNIFYGSEGYMTIDGSGTWKTYLGKNREPGPSGGGGGDMFQNFTDAIRADDRSILEGDITEGHYSCALIHLANISYRVQRSLEFDPSTEQFPGDKEANALLTREYREPFVIPEIV